MFHCSGLPAPYWLPLLAIRLVVLSALFFTEAPVCVAKLLMRSTTFWGEVTSWNAMR